MHAVIIVVTVADHLFFVVLHLLWVVIVVVEDVLENVCVPVAGRVCDAVLGVVGVVDDGDEIILVDMILIVCR